MSPLLHSSCRRGRIQSAPWVLALVMLAICALWPATARADDPYGVVTVDLRPRGGDVPTHVCVTSAVGSARARQKLSEIAHLGGDGGLSLLARESVTSIAEQQACTQDGDPCAPWVVTPPTGNGRGNFVACTADQVPPSSNDKASRVLVLVLEQLEAAPPAIESVNLAGGILTVGVGTDLRRAVIGVRSLGGDYLAHSRSFRGENATREGVTIALPIEPRCQARAIELRGAHLPEAARSRLDITLDGVTVNSERCVMAVAGASTLRVRLPGPRDDASMLRVALRAATGGIADSWSGLYATTSPGSVKLDPDALRLSWTVPACIVDAGTCPSAQLENGTSCLGTRGEGVCDYVCAGEGDAASVSTPTSVRMVRGAAKQAFTVIVQRPGQIVDGDVPSTATQLRVDLTKFETNRPGNRITGLEVSGEDGSVRRFSTKGRKQLSVVVPGASCEPVRVRWIGDLDYHESTAIVRDGELVLDPPSASARILSFHFDVLQGGGPVALIDSDVQQGRDVRTPVHFNALFQIAARFRPRKSKWSRLVGELRLGGTIGQWGYYSADYADVSPRPGRPKVPWMRFLVEPALYVDIAPVFGMSFALGLGSSWAPRTGDFVATDRYHFVASPAIDLRFHVRRWLSFVVQGRVFAGETVVLETPVPGGDVVSKELKAVSVIGLYGLQFRF